jgi:hypothetical protein
MLGVTGCGPDNEAEGQKASTKLGDPGKAAEGSTKDFTPPSRNEDRAAMGPQGSILQQGKQKTQDAKKK